MSKVSICGVTKKFGDVTALDNLSVTFEENKIYGLLGRNGAGKSTLLKIISNKIFPTSGKVLVDNENAEENQDALSKIYFMSEQKPFTEDIKIKDAFRWSGEFYQGFDMAYAEQLADMFKLNTKKKIKGLSTGYTSIYKVIIAFACNAEITLLDEPVLGLDANHRELFYKELLKAYSEKPRTFVISTHLIEEVSDIVEQVVIIKDGKLLIDDSVESVRKMGYGISGKIEDVDSFSKGKNIISEDVLGGLKTAVILEKKPNEIPSNITISPLDLQQLFIKLTNI